MKEAFTRLGYRKQINSHEEAIHHLIGTKMSSFAGSGKLLCNPTLSLSSWLNHLQCCLLAFYRVGLSLQFTVHKTVVRSGHHEYLSCVFTLEEWLYWPKKIDVWHQTLSRRLRRGCGLGTRLLHSWNVQAEIVVSGLRGGLPFTITGYILVHMCVLYISACWYCCVNSDN